MEIQGKIVAGSVAHIFAYMDIEACDARSATLECVSMGASKNDAGSASHAVNASRANTNHAHTVDARIDAEIAGLVSVSMTALRNAAVSARKATANR